MKEALKEITPRLLSEREAGWIRDILRVNNEWQDADISHTQVIAEGTLDEGVAYKLHAPQPENARKPPRESVGNLWIETENDGTVNIQLSQHEGRLKELYVLFIDSSDRKRDLPETWFEKSRRAVDI